MQNVALLTRDSAPNVALLERTPAAVAPAITTTALPGGIVGTAYSQVIQVTGTEPITASVLSGALPGGLTLAGATRTISGTPTAPVNAAFTVRASNSAGNADKALGILVPNEGVGGPAPAVTTVTLVPVSATVEAGGTTDLIVTVEDQAGNPIPNIVGTVETTSAASATGAWLVPTDASGQATVRVTGVAAGVSDVRAMADGLQSNATHVSVTASSVIACGFGVLEIATYPVSVGQGSVINCGLGVVELQAYPVEVEPSTVIDARLGVIEMEGIRPTVGANPTAEPSSARMMILKPDWIEGSGFMMIRGAPTFVKSDDEDLDFSVKWGGIFTAGETLIASRWNVPPDLTAGPATLLGDIATQWLAAGVVGQTYDIDNIVQTSKGRTYERSFRVYIVER